MGKNQNIHNLTQSSKAARFLILLLEIVLCYDQPVYDLMNEGIKHVRLRTKFKILFALSCTLYQSYWTVFRSDTRFNQVRTKWLFLHPNENSTGLPMKCYLRPLSWDSSFFLVKTLLSIGCSNRRDPFNKIGLSRKKEFESSLFKLLVGANIVNYLLPATNTLCDSNTCKNLTCTWIVYIHNGRNNDNIIEIMLFIKLLTS